jgi:ferrous iron transport protein A
MTLSELVPGARFTVTKVRVAGEIGRRLADMGFTEGSAGEMIRGALMRGPLQIRLGRYDLLIRRSEAACIEVEAVEGTRIKEDSHGTLTRRDR